MAKRVKELMTPNPTVLPSTARVQEAAELLRDDAIGAVIVVDKQNTVTGIVTDRDIVVRVIADGGDPAKVTLGDISTKEVTVLSPESALDEAVQTMRVQAVRRLPVVSDGKPVGIISLGDLAISRDPTSVLADISASAPDQSRYSQNGTPGPSSSPSRVLTALAAGAGLALSLNHLRNRGQRRSVRLAAKRLRATGRRLSRSNGPGSEATAKAAKYASSAARELRSQGKKMSRRAEKQARRLGREFEGKAQDLSKAAEHGAAKLSKQAEHRARHMGKRAERKAQRLHKDAEDRAKELGRHAQRKADEIKEMVSAGSR